jgi:hypothetical protein
MKSIKVFLIIKAFEVFIKRLTPVFDVFGIVSKEVKMLDPVQMKFKE